VPVQSIRQIENTAPQASLLPLAPRIMESGMNWDIIEGSWEQYKGQIKAQWGKLTNDHLEVIAGKRDQLAGKIQEAYGVGHDEADKQIKAFQKYLKESRTF
jgi:uncharacterized protein YjbJ (UPF0337 family)